MRIVCVKDAGEDFSNAFYLLAHVMKLQALGADSHPEATAQEVLFAAAKVTLSECTPETPQFAKDLLEFLMEPIDNTKPGKRRSQHLKIVREEPGK